MDQLKIACYALVTCLITQRKRGKVVGIGVHIYVYICLWTQKNLNRTLAIDSPYQTFMVGLLVKFID